MATKFEIGQRLYHNNRNDFVVVTDNTIHDSAGCASIKCISEESVSAGPLYLNISYMTVADNQKTTLDLVALGIKIEKSNVSWKFPVGSVKTINWLMIDDELSSENPAATVSVNNGKHERHFVVVHDSIVLKAKALGIYFPSESIDDCANVFESKNHFADVIDWVHGVHRCEWVEPQSTVAVTLVKLRR